MSVRQSPLDLQQRPTKPCMLCGAPTPLAVWRLLQICSRPQCRLTRAAQLRARRQREREQRAGLQRRLRIVAAKTRKRCAVQQRIDRPKEFQLIVLPANTAPLTPLPAARRRQFARGLWRLARRALAQSSEPPQVVPAPADVKPEAAALPVLATACAVCRGSCCQNGGTHAYLIEHTIQRYLDRHPGSTARDVVAAYWQHLPQQTYAGSCVFHTAIGCALPGEMRSDSCHAFLCESLIELHDYVSQHQSKFFLAAIEGRRALRGSFVEIRASRSVGET